MHVPSQEVNCYICVLGLYILPVSIFFHLDFGIVQTVWYFSIDFGTVQTVWYFSIDFGTVQTVWYFSIRFWNCSDSVVFFSYYRFWNCSDSLVFFVVHFITMQHTDCNEKEMSQILFFINR